MKAYGFGVATIAANGDVLDTWYLTLGLGDAPTSAPDRKEFLEGDSIRGVTKKSID